jgi:hypothetical protein
MSPNRRAWLSDLLALVCLVGICAALYLAGGIP